MNISLTGERPSAASSLADTPSATSAGSALSQTTGGFTGEDRISVTPSTLRIHSALSTLSASQASRVSRLQSLYASGRYDASASKIGQSIVSGALANTNKL